MRLHHKVSLNEAAHCGFLIVAASLSLRNCGCLTEAASLRPYIYIFIQAMYCAFLLVHVLVMVEINKYRVPCWPDFW